MARTSLRGPAAALKARQEGSYLTELSCCDVNEAFRRLESGPSGLSTDGAVERLARHGPNLSAPARRRSVFADIAARIKDPLAVQLLAISAISGIMGDPRSATVVAAMLLLSLSLSLFQERRSVKAAEALKKLIQASATVIRDGQEQEADLAAVVPGDVVALSAGSIIPADIRILSAKDFFVNQSSMTGESMPVEKSARVEAPRAADVLGLPNACFQGSTVVSGAARGLVLSTGERTLLGQISRDVARDKDATSFDQGVKSFVWLMVRFMIVMVSIVFLIVGLSKHDWAQALLFGLSVAVGLTPEMLPMIVTVCLSKGALSMSRKKVIVKKLKSIQNLGAMDVLCTDKTGTLTQDKIVLEKYVDVTDRPSLDVLRYAYMNSHYQTGLRNLLDTAILAHEDLDVERSCRKVDELPFDFVRKRMSVVIESGDQHVLICKGAVEEIYAASTRYQIDDEIYPMIEVIRNDLMEEYQRLSSEGYRVLAVAYREFGKEKESFAAADESDLVLLGYLAFFDPPKESAAPALDALRASGVRVKVLTGDNELVTRSVCRNVGFETVTLTTGPQLTPLTEAEFDTAVDKADVLARLSPLQKERIIRSLRKQGHVVGFLGDGINDAPALKAADVGISVDTAVDVAKESADIILLERSLLVLGEGINEGRRIFANIVKYIKMGASSNFGNMFSVVGGSYFLPFLPMSPIQVLLNNFLYDLSQTGIPTDKVDEEFVKRPQQWDIGFIRRFMVAIGPVSSLFDYATFFLMLYVFNCKAFGASAGADKVWYEHLFHTGWFVESIFTQTLIVHLIRTNRIPFLQSRSSVGLAITTLSVLAVAALLPYSPLASYLGLVALPAAYWAWLAGIVGCYAVLAHIVKVLFNRHYEKQRERVAGALPNKGVAA